MLYEADKDYVVPNSIEAMKVIIDRGVLDLMKPEGSANTAFHCFETEHHWCCASNHIDHEDEKENGYMVILLAKALHEKETAASFFCHCISETTEKQYIKNVTVGNKSCN